MIPSKNDKITVRMSIYLAMMIIHIYFSTGFMSFQRLTYDKCAYDQDIEQSTKPGHYMLGKPDNCNQCMVPIPEIRLQQVRPKEKGLVDVDSELMGLNRKQTKCRTYEPMKQQNVRLNESDCSFLFSEETRGSNPPCTLRGTGWNRWQWLCRDPQETAVVPFPYLVNYRLVVKDNHVPIIPNLPKKTPNIREEMIGPRAQEWNNAGKDAYPSYDFCPI